MLISGFTLIRNGVQFDFPFLESLQSLLPVCDEVIVNIGISEDQTKEKILQFQNSLPSKEAQKIKIFESEWPLNDPEKKKGGKILAEQTNLALDRCQGQWCLYLQADEVLHEDDYPNILDVAEKAKTDTSIEAIVFKYVHFYALYNIIQTSRSSYRREIRMVRNHLGIRSTGDAQSFRHQDGSKLKSILSKARIFHYGWVRPQEVMRQKTGFMDTLYHANASSEKPATGDNYLFKRFVGLKLFQDTHPKVMARRIERAPHFDFYALPKVFEIGDLWKIVSGYFERITGIRLFEFKNYILIKKQK